MLITSNLKVRQKAEEKLQQLNKELAYQNTEKEKRADELIIANKELAYQNTEKEKRADELIIANKELAYQNTEKEKRADELIIANNELAYQNTEKENRADELIIANKELAYQNEEKEKRADELIIANKELNFQNGEKEKHAAELILSNTELKKTEEQLITVNKELETFTYSVSHDLRAPLRAINGYSKILKEDYTVKLDADGMSSLNAILNNSKKMGELIDDLLAFSRLGRKALTTSEINMNVLVRSIKEEELIESSKKTEFVIQELPSAMGQQSLIRQVWVNLISNALKFSKYKPKTIIEIGSYFKDDLVVYYVKDKGAGFDMQYYDKLFGIFQRLHSQEEFEGTGIGLAIVQKIINRHNGMVWAESKLNEGSCFYFSLPIINS
ncbi:MAG: two-component sensor histidine kinase [Bacteroidetes bacterium RIFCSPLOWO2_12_FULL_35_15]|nr:MAG: two-component sensor histidine kinase [Bacteroidetes bacterium RIFCSPLOWO2_12_FULL_35_15]